MASQPPPGGPPEGQPPAGAPDSQPPQQPPYQPPAQPAYQPPAAQQPPPYQPPPASQAVPAPPAGPVYAPPPPGPAAGAPVPASPQPRKRRFGCFGCGCITALVLVVALVVVVFVALPALAQNSTPAPAEVVVIANPVQVKHAGGTYQDALSGQALNLGDSVKALPGGLGAIRFPDGSVTDVGPGSEMRIQNAQLKSDGNLGTISLLQLAGRSFSSVKSLATGSRYTVTANGTTAEVRGTKFEVLMDSKGTWIGVFKDVVHVTSPSGQSIDLTEGNDVRVNESGQMGQPAPLSFPADDPFALLDKSLTAALARSTQEPTGTQYYQPAIHQGQSSQQTYYSPGGDLSASLDYPGSLMRLTITGPGGVNVSAATAPPIKLFVPGAQPGTYTATVTALSVAGSGEPYALSITANPVCSTSESVTNGVIRRVFDPAALERSLAGTGVSLHIDISGVGNGVLLSGSGSYQGIGGSGAAVMYVNTPYYGIRITRLQIFGVPFSQALINQKSGIIGYHIDDLDPGFTVDRLYSCKASNGDVLAVLEGHA